VLASAYFAVADDDSSDSSTATTALLAPTTTAPFSKQYATTTDVNVRQGPGTRFAAIGAIETGKPVVVTCVAEGEPVEGPAGRDTRWLKVATPSGFVTAIYVAVGDDLRNKKIPVCPA
jgi:uncharacterized protein YraI